MFGRGAEEWFYTLNDTYDDWLTVTDGNQVPGSYMYRPVPYPEANPIPDPLTPSEAARRLKLSRYGGGFVILACWGTNVHAPGGDVQVHELAGYNYLYRDGHVQWRSDPEGEFYNDPHPSGDTSTAYHSRNSSSHFFVDADLQ
ncbi:MAG: hypothetical protein WD534_15820 [Phycisphaeraceae bacterium]